MALSHRPRGMAVAVPALLALALLNAVLVLRAMAPWPAMRPNPALAPEAVFAWLGLLALVAVVALLRARRTALELVPQRRPPLPRSLAFAAALVLMALMVGRITEVQVREILGRSLNVYWDLPQIPRFLWVSAQDLPVWQSALAVLGFAALVALLWAIARWAVDAGAQAAAHALRRPLAWAPAWGLTAAAMALLWAHAGGWRHPVLRVDKPVAPLYATQAKLLLTLATPGGRATLLPPRTVVDDAMALPPGRALAGLAGQDVVILFLESYGAVAYDDPRAAAVLRPERERFAQAIADGGWQVVSAFMRSPTFGGASDMAHLGLLSGIDMSQPLRHDVLLTTQRPTLLTLFAREGWETFGVYPAVRWDWPERRYYGFQRYLDGRDLGWRGPPITWWQIPDQFTLPRLQQLHPPDAGAPPRLVFTATINTHMPFSPVPPLQTDWQRLLGPDPFDAADVARALAESHEWLDMFPDYLRSMQYTYRWLGSWFGQPTPRPVVYVVLGDHQPVGQVAGSTDSFDVPVHIVSRDAALLARLQALGFTPGVEPPRATLGGLHDLTGVLLKVFGPSSDPALPRVME
jgi:hypothetical protein